MLEVLFIFVVGLDVLLIILLVRYRRLLKAAGRKVDLMTKDVDAVADDLEAARNEVDQPADRRRGHEPRK